MIRNVDNTEIIGISTCGTYPSWIDYTVASFYNSVDRVVVINSGYDIDNPDSGPIHRLEREHNALEKIDINNKIIEYTPTKTEYDRLFETVCKNGKDEFGRSGNITFASKIATNLPNLYNKERWILKLDSDQILYKISKEQLISLINDHKTDGFRFAQYADYYHDFEHLDSPSLPGDFTNDGSLFYKSLPNQKYMGQGSPITNVNQFPIHEIRTSHMRRISPPGVDKYEYYYKRYWYHTFGPNSINEHPYNKLNGKKLTYEEIKNLAKEQAIGSVNSTGVNINDLPTDVRIPYTPPLVCKMTPLEYVKMESK